MTNFQLPYQAESWLYRTSPRAWGYHKALVNEDDPKRSKDLAKLVPEEDMELIERAYGMV